MKVNIKLDRKGNMEYYCSSVVAFTVCCNNKLIYFSGEINVDDVVI